jgi:hypothetical protein
MTTSWKNKLQDAVPAPKREPPAAQQTLPAVLPGPRLRVIVREGRAARTEPVQQLALRLPQSLAARLDSVTAGQRHGAILKILSWSLDELERQDKVLDV